MKINIISKHKNQDNKVFLTKIIRMHGSHLCQSTHNFLYGKLSNVVHATHEVCTFSALFICLRRQIITSLLQSEKEQYKTNVTTHFIV